MASSNQVRRKLRLLAAVFALLELVAASLAEAVVPLDQLAAVTLAGNVGTHDSGVSGGALFTEHCLCLLWLTIR